MMKCTIYKSRYEADKADRLGVLDKRQCWGYCLEAPMAGKYIRVKPSGDWETRTLPKDYKAVTVNM